MAQLNKKFTDSQIKELRERYVRNEIERKYIQQVLGISKTRFFALIKLYRKNPNKFSVRSSIDITTARFIQQLGRFLILGFRER